MVSYWNHAKGEKKSIIITQWYWIWSHREGHVYPDLKVFWGQSNQFTETQAQKNNIYSIYDKKFWASQGILSAHSELRLLIYEIFPRGVNSMSQQCWGQTSISWSQCVLFGLLPITCRSRDKTILRSQSEGIHWCPGVPQFRQLHCQGWWCPASASLTRPGW